MPTISEVIDEKKRKIARLERDLALHRAVLSELERVSPNGATIPMTPEKQEQDARADSISSHIFAVIREHGGEMESVEIVAAVEARGATSTSEGGVGPSVAAALSKGVKARKYERVRLGVYKLKRR